MDVADMTTTGITAAGAWTQRLLERRIVEVADHIAYEMTTPHVAIAINADQLFASPAGAAAARIDPQIEFEQRIDGEDALDLGRRIVAGDALVGVDPQIGRGI